MVCFYIALYYRHRRPKVLQSFSPMNSYSQMEAPLLNTHRLITTRRSVGFSVLTKDTLTRCLATWEPNLPLIRGRPLYHPTTS